MADNGPDPARGVLALARAQDHGAGQRGPTPHRVHQGRPREVVETHAVEETTPPLPGTRNGINEGDEKQGGDEERVELDPFRHRPGDDGGCRGGKYGLEDEIGKQGVPATGVARFGHRGQTEPGKSEEPVEVPRVHEVEANDEVGNPGKGHHRNILGQDVHGVLGLGQAGLQTGEPGVHPEHEGGRNQQVEVVESVEDCIHPCGAFLSTGTGRDSGQHEQYQSPENKRV